MSIKIHRAKNQNPGSFDNNRILEKKPIDFPNTDSVIPPFSSLVYWAHAWSDSGGLIGLHPHQAFEIMSVVLEGQIEHYDTNTVEWKKLNTGDVQIIRAGSGISHSEKLLPNSQMFQIWFDPNIRESIKKSASYNDYRSDVFPHEESSNGRVKIITGEGSPLQMDSPAFIKEMDFSVGKNQIEITKDHIGAIFILYGDVEVNQEKLSNGDFIVVENEKEFNFLAGIKTKLFLIEVPNELPYKRFADSVS